MHLGASLACCPTIATECRGRSTHEPLLTSPLPDTRLTCSPQDRHFGALDILVIDKEDRRFATVAHIPAVLRVWFEEQPVEDLRPVRQFPNLNGPSRIAFETIQPFEVSCVESLVSFSTTAEEVVLSCTATGPGLLQSAGMSLQGSVQ
jgi:hypothetical protein